MAWPTNVQPFGPNHTPLLVGLSSGDGKTPVPVAVDPATGALLSEVVVSPAELPSTIINGQQTVTTSPMALSTNALSEGIIIEALSTNTVSVFIGGSGVSTSTGIELQPGASVSAAISNVNKLFVICASGSPVVSWLGS